MIQLTQDPTNPDRLILTAAVTLYLDRLLVSTLSAEVETAIREQAVRDLKSSRAVKKQIAEAATEHLLKLLGVTPDSPNPGNRPEPKDTERHDTEPDAQDAR